MKTGLAIIGAGFLMFCALGSIGVGHTVFLYGPDKYICTKESK